MRHRKKFNHLSRTSAHRHAMLSNMATSLILHKRITTTVAKAKALRIYVEPLLTRSKNDTTHSRRMVFSHLQSKEAVTELFREVSVKIADRPGGYTRIIKIGTRDGDNADMCMMELVDYNENLLGGGKVEEKSTGRRRRRKKGGAETPAPAAAPKAKATDKKQPQAKTEEEKPVAVAPAKEEEKPVAVAKEEAPVVETKEEEKPVAAAKEEENPVATAKEETKTAPADEQPEQTEDVSEKAEPEQEADTDDESTKKE
ncbi:50S ribosomal protein L17 [Candidatus Falkowbacteria bacterium]|jgi:large subunit ribosomal protein L17|nr:50S ribosomal protein L17 [Candidatus Falkowbacteria bacterium]